MNLRIQIVLSFWACTAIIENYLTMPNCPPKLNWCRFCALLLLNLKLVLQLFLNCNICQALIYLFIYVLCLLLICLIYCLSCFIISLLVDIILIHLFYLEHYVFILKCSVIMFLCVCSSLLTTIILIRRKKCSSLINLAKLIFADWSINFLISRTVPAVIFDIRILFKVFLCLLFRNDIDVSWIPLRPLTCVMVAFKMTSLIPFLFICA